MPVKESRDIEWLVNWALEGQGLGGGVQADSGSRSWLTLGTRVDGGTGDYFYAGRGVSGGAPDYDAVVIASAITGLPQEAAALVTRFGRLGYGEFARPDWCPEGEGEWLPVRKANGEFKYDYEDLGRRKPKVRMAFVGNSKESVAFFRAQYTVWWEALRDITPVINLAMKMHEATGLRAPERPWEAARQPVIHRDCSLAT